MPRILLYYIIYSGKMNKGSVLLVFIVTTLQVFLACKLRSRYSFVALVIQFNPLGCGVGGVLINDRWINCNHQAMPIT